jgi:hypothetical protein
MYGVYFKLNVVFGKSYPVTFKNTEVIVKLYQEKQK